MKKILILFTLLIVFIPNVKAVEISCSTSENLLKPNNFISGVYQPFDYSPSSISFVTSSYNALIPVEPSTKYSYKNSYNVSSSVAKRIAVAYYDKNFKYLTYFNDLVTLNNYAYSFTTNKDAYYITLHLYGTSFSKLNSNFYQLNKGSSTIDNFDYVQCPPDNPGPVVPDTSLSDFYQVTTSKLSFLATSFHENKILFSAILIPFFFSIFILVFRRLFL